MRRIRHRDILPAMARYCRGSAGLLLVASAGVKASLPSFDCSRAKGQAQELVCADEQLAELDRELARLYSVAAHSPQLNTKQRASLRAYQHGWIKGRNDCWKAEALRACVLDSYVTRIHELRRDYADTRVDAPGSLSDGPVHVSCDSPEERIATTFLRTDPPLACLESQGTFYTLALTPAASGARYATGTDSGELSFWSKGEEALLTFPGQPTRNCKVVPSE